MKKSTILLKVAVILIGIPVIVLGVLLWGEIGGTAIKAAGEGMTLGYIVLSILIGMTLSMFPFYTALIYAYKLITYIDKKLVFSSLAVEALGKIKRCAYIIGFIYVALLPFIYVIAEWDDAPGLIIIGSIPAFTAFVIGIFSSVLQYLLDEAVSIKTENDLTV